MTTVELLMLIIGMPIAAGLCIWLGMFLINDTVKYNEREQWRTLKNQKLEHYLKTGEKPRLIDMQRLDARIAGGNDEEDLDLLEYGSDKEV